MCSAAFCEVEAGVSAHKLENVRVLVVEYRLLAPRVVHWGLLVKVAQNNKSASKLNEAREVAQLCGRDPGDRHYLGPGLGIG